MSDRKSIHPGSNGRQGVDRAPAPDAEVVPKARRRTFAAEYKLRILADVDL